MLLDSRGRLIGINTAIASPSGASNGVGFAIPIDAVKGLVDQVSAPGSSSLPQSTMLYLRIIPLLCDSRSRAPVRVWQSTACWNLGAPIAEHPLTAVATRRC